MNYIFGTISRQNLDTCHQDLQLIAEESLKVSQVDFGITEGHRTLEKQQEYFETGASKCDGITKISKHQSYPSLAMDIRVYVPNKPELTYNIIYMAYLGGVITSVAERLLGEGKIKHKIRWGYNWNNNGEIGTDQTFQDMPHFELIELGAMV